MTQNNTQYTVAILLSLAMLALGACSSSFGSGSPPPHDTTVVVPPGSTVSE